jgi:hypothetical protein
MLPRRPLLLLPALAACAGPAEVPLNPALPRFDFLTPLRFDAREVEHVPAPPGEASRTDAPAPLSPAALAAQMGRERVFAAGTEGTARFIVERAVLTRSRTGDAGLFAAGTERLTCEIAVRLELVDASGSRQGFARAEVRRFASGAAGSAGLAERTVRQALDDLNVEFEFQIRRSLRDRLVATTTEPGSLEREELPRS